MIIRYNISNGNILGYTLLGGGIPEVIPENEAYLQWEGIEPNPVAEYQVVNNQVVLRSDAQAIRDDIKWRAIRGRRDQLLKDTDYLFYQDSPYSSDTTASYRTYRQSLRDIPQTYSNPDDVVYPTKPN